MPSKSSSTVCGMPFRKIPRNGQKRVFDEIYKDLNLRKMNVQLPTGYGKSFVNAGTYSILKKQNRVNRLLIVVPTRAQRKQFIDDGPYDLRDACITGPLSIIDIGYVGIKESLKRHRNNSNQVFIVTAQGLIGTCGDVVREMMQTGNWMLTVDEYHHYGLEKSWGESAKNLPFTFLLTMSATPYRKDDDSAFGAPDVVVKYREAVEEKAVKSLIGHSYIYRIDMLDQDKNIVHMTTDDLVKRSGSCLPNEIERFVIERKMRWSPKYISPLVSHPIERMLRDRIITGYKLQAIVGAMCVSHAKLVCEQVQTIFPELSVDWVGTGDDGRSDEVNEKIIKRFCPQKDESGHRSPDLDVLIHVGMAGEGLDSVNVSEVIHLNKASINNSNNQENGRASRFLDGVVGNINFDSCSEYAVNGYVGRKIMDAMDFDPPSDNPEDEDLEPKDPREESLLPEEPTIQIWDLELAHIDSGSWEVERMARSLVKITGLTHLENEIGNPGSELHRLALLEYRNMRKSESRAFNEQSVIEQWQESVKNAVSSLTGKIVRLKTSSGSCTFEKSLIGDIKRNINARKKYDLGELRRDVEILRKHYQWVVQLEKNIKESGLPIWLQ